MRSYTFKTALSGLWREKWINLLSALTIAAGLFIITLTLIIFHNIGLATKKLPDKFSVTVFVQDGLTDSALQGIIKAVKKNGSVKDVRYISKEDALKELKAVLRDADYILEGLDTNPLPASLELKLKDDSVTDVSVENLSTALKKIAGVEEVQYGRKFLYALQSVRRNSEAIGVVFMGVLSAGLLFVCYSTVKILFYRKKDEMETLKFLGATSGFIRAPFVIEGGVIGFSGGLLSMAGTFSLYHLTFYKLTSFIPLAKAVSMPVEFLYYAPAAGFLIGMAGAVIATGRLKF